MENTRKGGAYGEGTRLHINVYWKTGVRVKTVKGRELRRRGKQRENSRRV